MKRTGVFATPEEIESLKAPRPYLVFGTVPDNDGGFKPVTSMSALECCHQYALAHGLPEVNGYYGCDLTTGEFVSV